MSSFKDALNLSSTDPRDSLTSFHKCLPSRQASLASAKMKKGKLVCGPSRFHPTAVFLLTFQILKNYKVDWLKS